MKIEQTVTARYADKHPDTGADTSDNYSMTINDDSVALRGSFELAESKRGCSTIELSFEAFSYFVKVWNKYHLANMQLQDLENEVLS